MMDVDENTCCSTEFIPCELARGAAAPRYPRPPSFSPEGARFHSPGRSRRSPGNDHDIILVSPERAAPGAPCGVAPGWTTASHSCSCKISLIMERTRFD